MFRDTVSPASGRPDHLGPVRPLPRVVPLRVCRTHKGVRGTDRHVQVRHVQASCHDNKKQCRSAGCSCCSWDYFTLRASSSSSSPIVLCQSQLTALSLFSLTRTNLTPVSVSIDINIIIHPPIQFCTVCIPVCMYASCRSSVCVCVLCVC